LPDKEAGVWCIGTVSRHFRQQLVQTWGTLGHSLTLGSEWVGHVERLAAGKLSRDQLVTLFANEMGDPVLLDR
jgi:hypothetical protein